MISDIVSDEDIPTTLQRDPELWSGCVSGAFVEGDFLRAFERAGFHGVSIAERAAEPFAVVQLLWPDRNGWLPYESGFDPRVVPAQPVIGAVPG